MLSVKMETELTTMGVIWTELKKTQQKYVSNPPTIHPEHGLMVAVGSLWPKGRDFHEALINEGTILEW
jgi:hypothetical protein